MPDGRVEFEISGDGRKITATVEDVTKCIRKAGKEWDQSVKESTGNMESAFTKALDINRVKDWALKAGKAMLDFGVQCLQAASDLAEVQNVVDVTFGDGASEIERWAKKAQSQFGLTETQAKRFTSTIGAMMKSAGLAGPEIVGMSENLAGLAADMASFYNMDFETAFNKIRSGISGETEPLKQLGINMSVANLEAYALTQGVTKAFDKMSQGEQTMLRYQYLMQATADAQGDFARTADGYANAQRRVQTALESIKASIGTAFYDSIAGATSQFATFLETISKPKPTTAMDEFAKIDLDTAAKIAEIQRTASEAEVLIGTLESISGQVINYSQSGNLVTFIESLSGNISGLDGALKKAEQGNLNGAIDDLAEHLAQDLGGDPAKWKNLLQAISQNAEEAIAATQGDSTKTKEFLEKVAAGADDLTTDYSSYWSNLLGALGDKAGSAISALAGGSLTGGILEGIAGGANELKLGTGTKWKSFAEALGLLDDKGNVPTTLGGVAKALATNLGGSATEWGTVLQAISNNLPSVTTAVGNDGNATAGWLTAAAAAADDLGGDYSTNWKKLLVVYGENAGAAITALATTNDPGGVLTGIATGANLLKFSAPTIWRGIFGALQSVDGLSNIFNNGNAATNVGALAEALSGNSPDTSKAEAWQTFLGALSEHPEALSTLTETDAKTTAEWLKTMAEGVNKIDPNDADAWDKLFADFVQGLPGLDNPETSHAFFETIAQEFLAMGNQSEEAKAGLAALGLSTEEIDNLQRQWLLTCQDLVRTMPGLSSIINTQTGEIKGGTQAVRDYKDAWYDASMQVARVQALAAKESAFAMKAVELADYEQSLRKAQIALEQFEQENKSFTDRVGRDIASILDESRNGNDSKLAKRYLELARAFWDAQENFDLFKTGFEEAGKELQEYRDYVNEATGGTTQLAEETEEAAVAMTTLQKAANNDAEAFDTVKQAITKANDAMKALADYQEKVFNETSQSVGNVIKGFEKLGEKKGSGEWTFLTPAGQLEQERLDLEAELAKLDQTADDYQTKWNEINKKINSLGSDLSVQSMGDALESQLQYIKQYQAYMAQARQRGVSEDILASLADGTQESFDYLKALATTGGSITELNEKYKQVKEASEGFTNSLTNQKLAVDDTYNGLLETAREAVSGLNLGDEAYKSVEETVNAIVKALGDKKSQVETEVNAILELVNKLSTAGYGMTFGLGGGFAGKWSSTTSKNPFGQQANGLEYVPYDGYLALLHQGERIQTAAEADLSRRYSYQQPQGFDYNALGQAVGANIPNGNSMQIIWRGRVVADILSEQQADSYRAMERSGWK